MFDEIAGAYGSRFLLAAGGVGIALLCLVGILWALRNRRGPSPFVRGGRNRQPRLQVLDAAAVDARRRLVLVRRDDVEHLIMIGGPTDIVIESGISDLSKAEAPSFEAAVARESMAAAPQPRAVIAPVVAAEPEPPRPAAPPQPLPAARAVEAPEEIYAPHPAVAPVAAVEPAARAPSLDVAISARREPAPAPRRIEPAAAPAQSIPTVAEGAPVVTEDAAVRPVAPPPVAAPEPAPRPAAAAGQRELGGDFQSILEEEMSNNLRAERITAAPQPQPAAPRPAQPSQVAQPAGERREPELGAPPASDNALQTEVARIFGEMSVNRDK